MGSILAKGVDTDAAKWANPDEDRKPKPELPEEEVIKQIEADPYDGFFLPEERLLLQPLWEKEKKLKVS